MEDPSPYCPTEITPQSIEGLSQAIGYTVTFGSRFPLNHAVAHIVTSLTEAIEDVNCPGVGLPVQATAITKEGYTPFYVYSPSIDSKQGRWLTIEKQDDLVLLDPSKTPTKKDSAKRSATQLFD